MRRPFCVMHSLLIPMLVVLSLVTAATAVAGGTPAGSTQATGSLPSRGSEHVSLLNLPPSPPMQHDSDSVAIRPGIRTFLEPNYPNPFPIATTIAYSLAEDSHVELTIYDFDFVEVVTLVDEDQTAGRHRVIFDTRELELRTASGIYFYELKTNQGIEQRRMIYMK
jgi:hypothetical protein